MPARGLRRFMKALHELGAAGITGSFATCLVMASQPPRVPLIAYAALREEILAITHWLMMPSLVMVIISGFLAMLFTPGYLDAGWAWVKAGLGLTLFEATLMTTGNATQRVAELSSLVAAGTATSAQLTAAVHAERATLWLLLAVCLANIVLGVWRPRLLRETAPKTPPEVA